MTDYLGAWRELLAGVTPGPWRVARERPGLNPFIQSQHVRHPNATGAWADVAAVNANNYDNEVNAAHIVRSDRLARILADPETAEALGEVMFNAEWEGVEGAPPWKQDEELCAYWIRSARAVLEHLAGLAMEEG